MEAVVDASDATRNAGASLPPMSSASQPSRKEWRVVSEQSILTSGPEDLESTKLGQSDERLIYEHGREPVDVDFCSITIDGGLNNNILQQRLNAVAKQREELQQMEIELRAQAIIVAMHGTYDAQIKEHANANMKLQEQLHEKEQMILELERRMSEKERELHAIRLDNEAQAWAKEDLFREQSKELQSYMRDRDKSEAERVQHVKQIHDLQEHSQEKERQLMELQEQHRIAQETVLFKDEQIREAQAWITRAQEMDAFQSTTTHTLQAELRERTELYNQLWLGCQRQFAEMERLHLHIQQLQLELADLREKSGINSDGSHITQTNSNDASQFGQGNGSQLEVNGNSSPIANSGSLQNSNSESASSFHPEGNTSAQIGHVHGVAFAPTSLLGMPTYLPNGQVTALHPFVVHQQGMPHPSHVAQSPFHSVPMSALQSWQNQQTLPNGQPTHDQYPQQTEQNLPRADSHCDYEASANGQVVHANYLDANVSRRLDADPVVPSPNVEVDSTDKSYDNGQSLLQISSQYHDALGLDPLGHDNDTKERNGDPASDQGLNTMTENSDISADLSLSEAQGIAVDESTMHTSLSAVTSDTFSTVHNSNIVGNSGDSYLLDERALLASIARTIGSGGNIQISSTLPNRLGKMLAPLHWHDYKKKYGKLDDFVASHPELFFIQGDYIQLREGAQEIIAAKAAVAKVAAAAAAPSSYSSLLPSVSVTPMARSHRPRKVPSLGSSSMNADKASFNEFAVPRPSNIVNHPSQFASAQDQNLTSGSRHVAGGVSNVKILTKPKDQGELNSLETRPSRSVLLPVETGMDSSRSDISHSIGVSHGRPGVKLVGKQQSRKIGPASNRRR